MGFYSLSGEIFVFGVLRYGNIHARSTLPYNQLKQLLKEKKLN